MNKFVVAIAIAAAIASSGAWAEERVEICFKMADIANVTNQSKTKGINKEILLVMADDMSDGWKKAMVRKIVENVYAGRYKSDADRYNQVMLECLKAF